MIDGDFANPASIRLWAAAAGCAIALHAGCVAFAIARFDPDSADDAVGAPAIEIGLDLMAPSAMPTDLQPGPDSEASVASPAVMEQKADIKETELPKDKPVEVEDADRLVALNEAKKPEKDDPKLKEVAATASTASAAAEAKAMPTVENAAVATRSVAPVQGTGTSKELIRTTWQRALVAHLDKHKRYPADRSLKGAQIIVGLELDRMGRVLSARIVTGSGDASFDEAALSMIRRANPVPAPPPLVADEGLSFTLPVVFRVSKTRVSDR